MRVAFLASDKPRERVLADAFLEGAARHGHEVQQIQLTGESILPDADVIAVVGVKSRNLYQENQKAGRYVVMLDKGYTRHRGPQGRTWEYWRIAVNDHHPTRHLELMHCPADRWSRLGLDVRPWRRKGGHIVLAGSSAKYHEFYGLANPTTYAKRVVKRLRRHTDRPIVYRPKPSWRDAVPIEGTEYSTSSQAISEVLDSAYALVTHGSNACFEAMVLGVPSLILGNGVAKPISSISEKVINKIRLAPDAERMRLLHNLAYCQWTLPEFASGEAWETIKWMIYN